MLVSTILGFKKSKFITSIATFGFIAFNFCLTFAATCGPLTDDASSPIEIVCFIGRIFNILIWCVGLVFIAMVGWSAYKLSMSSGDPKGFEGVKVTLTYVFIGAGVIVGFFAIYLGIAHILNIPSPLSVDTVVGRIEDGLVRILNAAGIQ